jgi:hypothetical protein
MHLSEGVLVSSFGAVVMIPSELGHGTQRNMGVARTA